MKKQIFILLAALSCTALQAQRTYTIENINWANPWIGSGNMAALKANGGFLRDVGKSVSEAKLQADASWGDYKNIYDPQKKMDAAIGVESFLEVNKVNLYGRFGYNYDYGISSTWRGSIHPYDTPFMLADSIPGNTTMETYSMQAGISVPLGKWAVGVDVAYDVAILAKQKDLRNRNTDMTFRIAPSFVYNTKHFNVGLHAGYELSSEKVEYAKIAENNESYLFYLYGLWLNNSYSFSNAETSRLTSRGNWFGGLQFDFKFGNWTIFNVASVKYGTASQTETGYNNLIYGNTEALELGDKLVIQNGMRHRLTATVSSRELTGERFLQRQELDPASSIRRWVTYGDALPCYARYVLSGSLEYTYRQMLDVNIIPWELTVGVTDMMASQQYTNYPIRYLQKINYLDPYVSFTDRLYFNKVMFSINPTISYRIMTSGIKDDVKIAEGAHISGDPTQMQLLEPLQAEYDWWSANVLRAGLKLGFESGMFFGSIGYRYDYAHVVATHKMNGRHYANVTFGISF